jgi:translation initiation factor 1
MNSDLFFDPFAGVGGIDALEAKNKNPIILAGPKEKIHVGIIQQGRRFITTIEGLDDDLDQSRIARYMAKAFSCAATVQKDKEGNEIIQLQGDHRLAVRDWLVMQEVITSKEAKERLVLHGF